MSVQQANIGRHEGKQKINSNVLCGYVGWLDYEDTTKNLRKKIQLVTILFSFLSCQMCI